MTRYSHFFALLLLALPLTAAAQHADSPVTYGRHSLSIQMGLLNHTIAETSVGVGTTDSRVSGFAGSIAYAYWVKPDWAATVSVGVLDAETSTSVNIGTVNTKSAAVTPVLFGAKYSPVLSGRPSVRPYLWGAAGPYVGSASVTRTDGFRARVGTETITETAFGFRAMAGADWFVGRHFTIGFGAGYHFVGDFDQPIGSDENYSGPEFSFGVGFAFGRGR